MPRYLAIPSTAPSHQPRHSSWDDEGPMLVGQTVLSDDDGPVRTGLLDHAGTPIYRMSEKIKMGFKA